MLTQNIWNTKIRSSYFFFVICFFVYFFGDFFLLPVRCMFGSSCSPPFSSYDFVLVFVHIPFVDYRLSSNTEHILYRLFRRWCCCCFFFFRLFVCFFLIFVEWVQEWAAKHTHTETSFAYSDFFTRELNAIDDFSVSSVRTLLQIQSTVIRKFSRQLTIHDLNAPLNIFFK